MMKCDGCGRRSETGLGERCGVRLSGDEWCSGTVREDFRSMRPGAFAAIVLGAAAGLGVRFNWAALGAILLRATDEELAALFRPTRGGR